MFIPNSPSPPSGIAHNEDVLNCFSEFQLSPPMPVIAEVAKLSSSRNSDESSYHNWQTVK